MRNPRKLTPEAAETHSLVLSGFNSHFQELKPVFDEFVQPLTLRFTLAAHQEIVGITERSPRDDA